ncbi:MAG: hypothetical protein ACYCT9_09740 [Leptospirillum sp.]
MAQENTDKNTNLSRGEDYLLSIEFENALAHDDGRAAKQHLAAGRPVYYGDERFPEGLIKEYPNGYRQIVSVDPDGRITVIRDL